MFLKIASSCFYNSHSVKWVLVSSDQIAICVPQRSRRRSSPCSLHLMEADLSPWMLTELCMTRATVCFIKECRDLLLLYRGLLLNPIELFYPKHDLASYWPPQRNRSFCSHAENSQVNQTSTQSVLPAYQRAGSKSVSTECCLCSRGRKEKLAYQKPDQIGRGETAKCMK